MNFVLIVTFISVLNTTATNAYPFASIIECQNTADVLLDTGAANAVCVQVSETITVSK